MLNHLNYSQVNLIPNCTVGDFLPTACIGFNTNIYYNSSETQISIVTSNKTYVASWSGNTNVLGCALAIPSDGSCLFVATFITTATTNNQISYSLIPLSNGIPTTDPPTVQTFLTSIPTQTNSAFFNGNAFYQLQNGQKVWYCADFDNSIIWAINSTSNTATLFAQNSSHRSIAGVASDGSNLYTAASDSGAALLFTPLATGGTLSDVNNTTTGFSYAADITFVPAPVSQFYVPNAISNVIVYGTIDIKTNPLQPSWVPATTSYDMGANTGPFTIGFSNSGGTNTLRFYVVGEPEESNLWKLYLTTGGSSAGGDPHICTLFGNYYTMPSKAACFRLIQNSKAKNPFTINCSCWFLDDKSKKIWDKKHGSHSSWMDNLTYMRYISFGYKGQALFLDLETLEPVKFTTNQHVFENALPKQDKPCGNQNILLGPVFVESKGLYSLTHRKYDTTGKTLARRVKLISSDCEMHILLSHNLDSEERNHLSIHLKSTQELCEQNFSGALVSRQSCQEISNLIDFEPTPSCI